MPWQVHNRWAFLDGELQFEDLVALAAWVVQRLIYKPSKLTHSSLDTHSYH